MTNVFMSPVHLSQADTSPTHKLRFIPALLACPYESALQDAVFMCIESGECHEAAAWNLEQNINNPNSTHVSKTHSPTAIHERRAKSVVVYKRAARASTRPGAVVFNEYPSFAFGCLGLALRRMGMACMYVLFV